MKNWSKSWNKSIKPRKQRLFVRNAPLHVKSKLMGSHLSKELRVKYKSRALRVRKGDKVKILRGQFKGKTGSVERIDTKKQSVFVTGIEILKKDGSKTLYPLHYSNLLIIELNVSDKFRLGEKK
ncbi:50S ribosomal protein L24 [Candidatus Woesearchaeota archaeon]|nr:MAG: 50S ribosomal protein L24 [Candidatus Woesearchaeota archaeon]